MLNRNQKIVEEFLQYLKLEKQYSFHTTRAYKVDLNQFFNSLKSKLVFTEISTNDIQLFLQRLSQNKMSERTLSRKLASIKSLFNYLLRKNNITVNIAKLIKAPKIPKRLPNYLSTGVISSLLNYPYGDTF
jgi:integrase/recombinase XerC